MNRILHYVSSGPTKVADAIVELTKAMKHFEKKAKAYGESCEYLLTVKLTTHSSVNLDVKRDSKNSNN